MPSVGARMRAALRTKPRKFQVQGVRFLEQLGGRGIIGDGAGLGKTYQGIAWSAIHPEVSPIVIVSPVKYHWQKQYMEHAGKQVQVLEGRKAYTPSCDIVAINYEILAQAEWPGPEGKRRKGDRPRFPWVETLKAMKPKLVILDELHYLQDRASLRTRAVTQLAKKCPHIIPLSATAIKHRPVDFFPTLQLLAPREFKSFWKYAFRYCAPKRGFRGRGWNFKGHDNLDELHERISKWMIRRRKVEVAKELPPKVRSSFPVKITNRKEYNHAAENFLEWLEAKVGKDATLRAAGAVSLVRLGALKRIAALGKLKAICSWINDFLRQTDEKLIVFCVHRTMLTALKKAYPTAASICGNVPQRKRQAQVDKFEEDPKCRVFIGQLKAAGVGTDGLHKAASAVLFTEFGWRWADHEQAEDRALRLGQEADSVNVYYMVAKDTIEEKILEVIEGGHDICNKVLDGKVLEVLNLLKLRRTDGLQFQAA